MFSFVVDDVVFVFVFFSRSYSVTLLVNKIKETFQVYLTDKPGTGKRPGFPD